MTTADVLHRAHASDQPMLSSPPSSTEPSPSFWLRPKIAAFAPRSVFSRLMNRLVKLSPRVGCKRGGAESQCLRLKKRKKGGREEQRSTAAAKPDELPVLRVSNDGGEEETGTQPSVSSGRKPDGATFILGLGVGLLLHSSRSTNQFSKIIEMQSRIETLLKETKSVVERKDNRGFRESSNNILAYASDYSGTINTSNPLSVENCITLEKEELMHSMVNDEKPICDKNLEHKTRPKMDRLEAELEVELQRLHFNLEEENVRPHGIEATLQKSVPSERLTFNVSENMECNEEHKHEFCGVPPIELERKLHDLLHRRQQERIKELECTLEFTKRKLKEKETEASMWRETAMLASKNLDVPLLDVTIGEPGL